MRRFLSLELHRVSIAARKLPRSAKGRETDVITDLSEPKGKAKSGGGCCGGGGSS